MQAIGFLIFLALGVLQMAATYAGLHQWLGLHWMIAGFLVILIAWSPLIGTALGIVGAVKAWGWSIGGAILLLAGPLVLAFVIVVITGGIEAWRDRRGRG